MAPSMSLSPTAAAATLNAAANPTNDPRWNEIRTTAALNAAAAEEARFFAKSVASWYLNTIDPYAPHTRNVESRLRHPLHVVTRRILYGNVRLIGGDGGGGDDDDLEALFNDDDAEIKDGGPEALTRRSAARMEAFLASCSAALREDHPMEGGGDRGVGGGGKIGGGVVAASSSKDGGKGKDAGGIGDGKKNKREPLLDKPIAFSRTRPNSTSKPRTFRQIDLGDLLLMLEVYCRT